MDLKGLLPFAVARGKNFGGLFLLPWRATEADDDVPHVNASRLLRGLKRAVASSDSRVSAPSPSPSAL